MVIVPALLLALSSLVGLFLDVRRRRAKVRSPAGSLLSGQAAAAPRGQQAQEALLPAGLLQHGGQHHLAGPRAVVRAQASYVSTLMMLQA